LRFFHRHDDLNANNFFNNATGLPRALDRYNYYGYDVGGPILLPHTRYNRGRVKLFFFFNQQYFQQLLPSPAEYLEVPTAAERAGNFSSSVDGNGNPISVVDPLSTGNCAGTTHACFSGNIIPSSRISPLGTQPSCIHDDPLQVVVRLKPDAQCLARSCVETSWRAHSSRAYSSGWLSLQGGTERWISSSPSRILASTSC